VILVTGTWGAREAQSGCMRGVGLLQDGGRVWVSRRVGELASKRAGG